MPATARDWCLGVLGDERAVAKHFVAVSTNAEEVARFGIDTANMFGFWDWVGGRYSMDSAIGLSTMLAIGPNGFRDMLAGFRAMDEHFLRSAPFERELAGAPWGYLECGTATSSARRRWPFSPTTSISSAFRPTCSNSQWRAMASTLHSTVAEVNYDTGAIYWGEPGTNGQHSFYQLIHQGTRLIPCDFIGFCQSLNPLGNHHDLLMANLFAQTEALAFGKTPAEVKARERRTGSAPIGSSRAIARRARSWLDRLTPATLGNLVALYEHSVFTQGSDLGHRLVRPVGRGTRQGPGPAHHPGARRARANPS